MTMTGNTSLKDEVGNLVDDSLPPNPPSPIQQAIQAIKNLILPTQHELITLMRTPTPMKVSKLLTISATGNLGGSVGFPTMDQIIYTAPVSAEAWLHRITITSPEHGPASPIIAPAELVLIGSTAGEVILSLPEIASTYQVAPTQFIEGRFSAPHLDRGESLCVAGDGLPANAHLRFDLQIIIVTGASEFTPRTMSPSDLTRREAPGIIT
jgi:hypothetical protein